MKLVLVEWVDSASCSGWHRLSLESDCICSCVAAGLLCHEDEKQGVITYSKSDSGNIAETISIPKSCIKRIRQLKVARK